MKKLLPLLFFFFISNAFHCQTGFYNQQLTYSRFKSADEQISFKMKKDLSESGFEYNKIHLLLIAFKEEGILKCYLKSTNKENFILFKSYEICDKSGNLGPKLKQGDNQVPEGFYYINAFNPVSSFYLSLGINYPNSADRNRSNASNLGGDIFIHGSCVTIGCLPMTDEKIREIYWLAVMAKNNGQTKIPVYIFPFEMTNENIEIQLKNKQNMQWNFFWESLKKGYDQFNGTKMLINYKSNLLGNYLISN